MTPGEYYAKFGTKTGTKAVARSKRRESASKRRNVNAANKLCKKTVGRPAGPRKNERTMPVGSPDGTDPQIRAAKTSA